MKNVHSALDNLNKRMTERNRRPAITFDHFFSELSNQPEKVLRNVFQVFHDLIVSHMGSGVDEYKSDPESIHYVNYDCSRLFETDTDRPFFADRLFANRLFNLADGMKRGAQQNKIYIFNGPPGCGKSTFLNNLLKRFEAYANSDDGMRYEIVWRLDPSNFGTHSLNQKAIPILEQLAILLNVETEKLTENSESFVGTSTEGTIEIACPSHDHPILLIPKNYRERFLSELFEHSSFKETLFSEKKYSWVFKDKPCTFCSTIYRALLNKFKDPAEVHNMIFARHYRFNRRLGEGISVFNPGDIPTKNSVLNNPLIQRKLNLLLNDYSEVQFLYSRYAKTNNGIYALMDIKSHNTDRIIELHNIISEGVHKVEDIEENVNSLLIAVMNPEDQKNLKDFKSFSDRIEYINIPYVMDVGTEEKIYKNIFGKHIASRFLPQVLENFARVIVSSRLNTRSEALLEWIGDPRKYSLYCDENLQLLKMEIYAGVIPSWLSEEDRRELTAKRRRKIINESDREGISGISGRDSIKIFNEFISTYTKQDKLITMSMLCDFFTRKKTDLMRTIPTGFIDSLLRMYNYTVLQQVKESLYYYNERQISRNILNYLFAINFEPPATEICSYTQDKLTINEDFFQTIESRILISGTSHEKRRLFREETQAEYTSKTLTQEIMVEGKEISQTEIFAMLYTRYVQNLKEKVLDPFLDNSNFRRAIKDFETEDFKTYDRRIRSDVRYLMRNLRKNFGYTDQGAREVCMYVIDNDLARKFKIS